MNQNNEKRCKGLMKKKIGVTVTIIKPWEIRKEEKLEYHQALGDCLRALRVFSSLLTQKQKEKTKWGFVESAKLGGWTI